MRTALAAAAVLAVVVVNPARAGTPRPNCDPNPLTQGHPGWMKMPSGAVDKHTPAPVSAMNPMMVGMHSSHSATPATDVPEARRLNPLTNRP